MTRQYKRALSLIVANPAGVGLDLANFKVEFKTGQWDVRTPNTMVARIMNLAPATATRIRNEFTQVRLQAGYEGNVGTIFAGTIKETRRGRATPVDEFLELFCGDGDQAYNFAVVNGSVAAGATPEQRLEAIRGSFGEHGVQPGYTGPLHPTVYPRGCVNYGMTREVLTQELGPNQSWSIQAGQCEVVPRTSYIPGDVIVLTAKTGLVGLPEQTEDGITARCLLNPNIRINGRVKIDNSSIQGYQFNLKYAAINFPAQLARDGIYKVLSVEHSGDSRGQDWYSDLVCVSVEQGATIGQAVRGRGGPF